MLPREGGTLKSAAAYCCAFSIEGVQCRVETSLVFPHLSCWGLSCCLEPLQRSKSHWQSNLSEHGHMFHQMQSWRTAAHCGAKIPKGYLSSRPMAISRGKYSERIVQIFQTV